MTRHDTDTARSLMFQNLRENTLEARMVARDIAEEYSLAHPYAVDGPAKISFSGGRTSAYMLKQILDYYRCRGQDMPTDVHVLFANTGKERNETLDFVHACSSRWEVPVHWIERDPDATDADGNDLGYREVTYATAARNGAPFQRLIEDRNYLPNPVTRFCTEELKIRAMGKWMIHRGYEHWTNIVGLRADEPKRVTRIRVNNANGKARYDVQLPLSDAGAAKPDVLRYFREEAGFDLELKDWEGNCDLCFLKGRAKRTRIMRDNPTSPDWWIANERAERVPRSRRMKKFKDTFGQKVADGLCLPMHFGEPTPPAPGDGPTTRAHPFRIDAPRYEVLFEISKQPMFAFDEAELQGEAMDDIGDCFCNAS